MEGMGIKHEASVALTLEKFAKVLIARFLYYAHIKTIQIMSHNYKAMTNVKHLAIISNTSSKRIFGVFRISPAQNIF